MPWWNWRDPTPCIVPWRRWHGEFPSASWAHDWAHDPQSWSTWSTWSPRPTMTTAISMRKKWKKQKINWPASILKWSLLMKPRQRSNRWLQGMDFPSSPLLEISLAHHLYQVPVTVPNMYAGTASLTYLLLQVSITWRFFKLFARSHARCLVGSMPSGSKDILTKKNSKKFEQAGAYGTWHDTWRLNRPQ